MKGVIKINGEHCKGCRYCTEACPAGVIALSADFNRSGYFPAIGKHPEKCTGCAICAHMCPELAIEVYRHNNHGEKPRAAQRKDRK